MASSSTEIVAAAGKLATLADARFALGKVHELMAQAATAVRDAASSGTFGTGLNAIAGSYETMLDSIEQITNRASQLEGQLAEGEGPLDPLMGAKLGLLLTQANDTLGRIEDWAPGTTFDLASVIADGVATAFNGVAAAAGSTLAAAAAGAAAGVAAFWPYLVVLGAVLWWRARA